MKRKKETTQPIPESQTDLAVHKIMLLSVDEWERLKIALERGGNLRIHAIKHNLHVVLSELGFSDINTEVTANVDIFFQKFLDIQFNLLYSICTNQPEYFEAGLKILKIQNELCNFSELKWQEFTRQLHRDPIFATKDIYIRFQIILNYFNAQEYADPSESMFNLFFNHLLTLPNSFTKSQASYKLGKILDL